MWKGPSHCGYDSPGKVAPGYIRKQSERVWGASLSKQCSSMCIKGDDSCLGDFWVCSLAQTKYWMAREVRKLSYWGKKRKKNLGRSECEDPMLNFIWPPNGWPEKLQSLWLIPALGVPTCCPSEVDEKTLLLIHNLMQDTEASSKNWAGNFLLLASYQSVGRCFSGFCGRKGIYYIEKSSRGFQVRVYWGSHVIYGSFAMVSCVSNIEWQV